MYPGGKIKRKMARGKRMRSWRAKRVDKIVQNAVTISMM